MIGELCVLLSSGKSPDLKPPRLQPLHRVTNIGPARLQNAKGSECLSYFLQIPIRTTTLQKCGVNIFSVFLCQGCREICGDMLAEFSERIFSSVWVSESDNFNSVHTRCIVKTSGFTRGVCKNRDFIKFKGFLVEFLERRRS